jgi:hypothetical protein
MYMMEILYMASIYGLVTEIQKITGFLWKNRYNTIFEKKNYSGFYGKTAAKPFLQRFFNVKTVVKVHVYTGFLVKGLT